MFEMAGNHCCPSLFPGDPPWQYTVAPFATDTSFINGDGEVSYEIHTLSSDSGFLSEVNKFLHQRGRNQFSGTWMLVANWKNIPENVRCLYNYVMQIGTKKVHVLACLLQHHCNVICYSMQIIPYSGKL